MNKELLESDNIEDADLVEVSVDPEEAEKLGALEETALTEEEAKASQSDDIA